jgi:hypothetical protein
LYFPEENPKPLDQDAIIELDSLSFLMDIIEKNSQRSKEMLQEGRKWRKKRQEEGSANSSTDSIYSGSGPDYRILYRLDSPLDEGNV